jgi:molybdopterin-containing oxidoreductase family iron-sulfur binding subunit
MEKCTFCVQRIRVAKDKAKMANRPVQDGEFTTACAQACPTNAIVFGDRLDENSIVAKLWKQQEVKIGETELNKSNPEKRGYRIFEELNVDPSIMYMERVREEV